MKTVDVYITVTQTHIDSTYVNKNELLKKNQGKRKPYGDDKMGGQGFC